MKKVIYTSIALMFFSMISKAQTAMQFSGLDCNGQPVDLFADLDAGKAVVLHFYMPNCGSCPPPAQKIQAMTNRLNALYPGKIKGYAFPYQNSTTCSYSSTWVSSNGLSSLFAPMDSGALHVANYGGFGMPTVVLLGGKDHQVLFSTLSFSTSDTTIMKNKILSLFGVSRTLDLPQVVSSFGVYPNPASNLVTFNISLDKPSDLSIDIMDMTGRQLASIVNATLSGDVIKHFSTDDLSSGTYWVRIQANEETYYSKISVIK